MPDFTALHRLLGLPASTLSDDMINDAVAQELRETDDLDWKSDPPPRRALNETDFPKDVAAMANRGGGTLVYGVTEAEKKASGRKDTGELDEAHERALRSAAYTAIVPPIFGLGIHRLGDTVRSIVVVVPATTDGPHLIFRNELFGAPIREDADTVCMKERQIEAMYRARLEERRRSVEVLEKLYSEAVVNWHSAERATLIAVAHPRLPIVAEKRDRKQARDMFHGAQIYGERWANGGAHPLGSVDVHNPRPGLRRWVAPNVLEGEHSRWRAANAAIHHDGCVSLGAVVGGHRSGARGEYLPPSEVESRGIEAALADFMGLIREVAMDFVVGEFEVLVGIENAHNNHAPEPILISTLDNFGHRYVENSLPMAEYARIASSVDGSSSTREFIWQLADLAEDAVNQGGVTNLHLIKRPEPDARDLGGEDE